MRVYHDFSFGTRIQINVSGSGSGSDQMIRTRPDPDPDPDPKHCISPNLSTTEHRTADTRTHRHRWWCAFAR